MLISSAARLKKDPQKGGWAASTSLNAASAISAGPGLLIFLGLMSTLAIFFTSLILVMVLILEIYITVLTRGHPNAQHIYTGQPSAAKIAPRRPSCNPWRGLTRSTFHSRHAVNGSDVVRQQLLPTPSKQKLPSPKTSRGTTAAAPDCDRRSL